MAYYVITRTVMRTEMFIIPAINEDEAFDELGCGGCESVYKWNSHIETAINGPFDTHTDAVISLGGTVEDAKLLKP